MEMVITKTVREKARRRPERATLSKVAGTASKRRGKKMINKEEVIQEMMPYIKYTAYRYQWKIPPQLTVDDLVSAGVMGLLDAIDKFDSAKNVKLKTYAEFRIKGAILDEIRANDWAPKTLRQKMSLIKAAYADIERAEGRTATEEEVAERLGMPLHELLETLQRSNSAAVVSLEELGETWAASSGGDSADVYEHIADPDAESPLEVAERKARQSRLADMINELEEKERLVVALYYYEEMTLKEIGLILDLTESRICQIHSQALAKLKIRAKDEIAVA